MVDVSSQSNKVNITVSSSGVSSSVNASGDTSHYYSEKAREWAISNRIVDGVDYSSKYYANKSNQSALNAQSFAQSAQDSYNNFQNSVDGALSTVNDTVQGAITTIDTKSGETIEIINNSIDGVIEDIEAEANEQIANIERTGFYMRDDKLYFINSEGEEEEFKTNDNELNNPFSLLDYKYSEYELNNLSWLRSNGQYNSKAVYPAVYDLLLKIYNGTETKAGVSVKLSTEAYTDYDFILNTAEETFRLPVKVKLASGKAVVGNGYGLGLIANSPNNQFGLAYGYSNNVAHLTTYNNLVLNELNIAGAIPQLISYPNSISQIVGITTDKTKSNIETSDSDLYLYFYVGETVQNANLINAGRIEEKIADVIPNNSELIMSYGLPDYSKGVAKTANTEYIAETFGCMYIEIQRQGNAGGYAYFVINDTTIKLSSDNYGFNMMPFYLEKGDVYKITLSNAVLITYTFYPLKGVK